MINSEPFLTTIIKSLKETGLFASSGSVMLLAAKDETPPASHLPAAYVLPLEETAEKSVFSDGDQIIMMRFAIVQCYEAHHQNLRTLNSLGHFEDVLQTRSKLIPIIKNIHDENHSSPDFTKGKLVHFGKGTLWWEDQFVTKKIIHP